MNTLFALEPQPEIEGLTYLSNFISREEEQMLLSYIDSQPWLTDLKRRVQHYGYKYDYKARTISKDSYLGPLPQWLEQLTEKLIIENIFTQKPDQVIVNEYLPGQGISAHIDCEPCFGETIASLTLGAGAIMKFIKSGEKREQYLEPRSLIVLSGAARYGWQHAIPARLSDTVDGVKVKRQRRVSLTFRNVILPE